MRWLLLPVGLVIGGLAAWLLLAVPGEAPSGSDSPPVGAGPQPSARSESRAKPAPARTRAREAPMGEIDAESRRRLEDVLEREGIGP